jgi:hypothetical protein
MGSIIKVENDSSKTYLMVNKEDYKRTSEQSRFETGYSAGGSLLGIGSLNAAYNLVSEKSAEWAQSGKSVKEQVK